MFEKIYSGPTSNHSYRGATYNLFDNQTYRAQEIVLCCRSANQFHI